MPIFRKNGKTILFVHIPKTGGTTIEKIISSFSDMNFYSRIAPANLRVCPQHLPVRDLKVLLGARYWDWSFSIVRNPYDRIESEFCFRTETGNDRYGQSIDFSTWAIDCISKTAAEPCFWDNHFRPQTDFIDSDMTIFKFENGLDDVISEVTNVFDIETSEELSQANASNRIEIEWSLDALNMVNEFYSVDFEQLGYKKRRKKLSFFR